MDYNPYNNLEKELKNSTLYTVQLVNTPKKFKIIRNWLAGIFLFLFLLLFFVYIFAIRFSINKQKNDGTSKKIKKKKILIIKTLDSKNK